MTLSGHSESLIELEICAIGYLLFSPTMSIIFFPASMSSLAFRAISLYKGEEMVLMVIHSEESDSS